MDFKNIIAEWYAINRRELPWRNTNNPYHIWVSEVILQQTRVVQGIGYYQRFINSFPTVFDLANANEDEVLKLWQGLGYYTRARNLHNGAKLVVCMYNGIIPNSYHELIKIKGIGSYSAGAIASFAFKIPVPAIDGNVYRLISRIFGVFTLPTTSAGKREFHEIVFDLIDKNAPDVFNQALLDFGALQCTPKSPRCGECPFAEYCYAFRNNIIDSLPAKGKKIVPRDRFFTYLLIRHNGYSYISKRKSNDIWHSLYEFPLIETTNLPEVEEIVLLKEWKQIFGKCSKKIRYISPVLKHQLSHQTLFTRFIVVEIETSLRSLEKNFIKVLTYEIERYSVPQLIDNFLAAEPAAKYFLNTPL